MKYTREIITKKYDSGKKLKYIFFWGHRPSTDGSVTKSCFSQWFNCKFTIDGIQYTTAEQYMMSQKALLFGDTTIYNEIMNASHPDKFKALGRKIKGFKEEIWDNNKTDIVIRGNLAKFSQNKDLKDFLLSSKKSILVEASPYDKIWGIGMSADNENIENPHKWRGKNLLGFCLMEVRDKLMEENL